MAETGLSTMLGLAFGGYEWIIILVVALLLFGHRIPGMARSLGSGIVEFKKGLKGGDGEKLPPPDSPADDKTRHEGQAKS